MAVGADGDAAELGLKDPQGVVHKPFGDPDAKAVAMVFVTVDCPISNAYAPEMTRIYKAFADRGVRFYLVHVDPDVDAEDVKKHAKEYKLLGPTLLLDPQHRMVKYAGATITPEAAVFSAKGELKYRGRIDDLYGGLGEKRRTIANRDFRDALTAVLAGKPVKEKFTHAFGCYVPNHKKK